MGLNVNGAEVRDSTLSVNADSRLVSHDSISQFLFLNVYQELCGKLTPLMTNWKLSFSGMHLSPFDIVSFC